MRKRRNAGALNEHLTIEEPVADPERNALGKVTDSNDNWQPYALQWAEVLTRAAAEQQKHGLTVATATHLVRVRYGSSTQAIDNTMRVSRPNGAKLDIAAAYDPTGRKEWIHIEATNTLGV
ncbi:MAG: phage head closure protein [Planctomycetota bacterium]|jgi:SPP1 family predicted phage head-tail adaptor